MTDEARSLWDHEAQTFDDAADHGLRDPAIRRAWADLLLPLVGDPGRRVADLGCGTGTLSVLLAVEGRHVVRGVDFSPEMVRRARAKAEGIVPLPTFTEADAARPGLSPGSYDVVLARHVLWAMPDPAAALATWIDLLVPTGMLILIEGRWHTGVGLRATECAELVGRFRDDVSVQPLDDASFWGRAIDDERYLIVSRR